MVACMHACVRTQLYQLLRICTTHSIHLFVLDFEINYFITLNANETKIKTFASQVFPPYMYIPIFT